VRIYLCDTLAIKSDTAIKDKAIITESKDTCIDGIAIIPATIEAIIILR
jgi:hypothetical protein